MSEDHFWNPMRRLDVRVNSRSISHRSSKRLSYDNLVVNNEGLFKPPLDNLRGGVEPERIFLSSDLCGIECSNIKVKVE